MNYKIIGDSDAPIVDITLSSGETIKVERGAMAFMRKPTARSPALVDWWARLPAVR